MRFRGLKTERHDVGPGREGMRREAEVQTFFARELSCGARGDARPFWALMAYAHGHPQATADTVARALAASKRASSDS